MINRDMINKCKIFYWSYLFIFILDENKSIYKNMKINKSNLEIPHEDKVYDIYKKMCVRPQYVENQ